MKTLPVIEALRDHALTAMQPLSVEAARERESWTGGPTRLHDVLLRSGCEAIHYVQIGMRLVETELTDEES